MFAKSATRPLDVDADRVCIERDDCTETSPCKIDWRRYRGPQREAIAKEVAISLTEPIRPGKTLELGTVHALIGEIELRVPLPPKTAIIQPATCALLARGLLEDEPTAEDPNKQKTRGSARGLLR